jgi:hypothetical protein
MAEDLASSAGHPRDADDSVEEGVSDRMGPHGSELQSASASERPPGGSHATAHVARGAKLGWPRGEGLGRLGGLGPHCVFYFLSLFLSYFLFFSPLFSFKLEFQI